MSSFEIRARNRQYNGLGLAENEDKWRGPFMFVVGTDTQFGMIDTMAKKTPIRWDQEIELTRKAIKAVNAMKPRPRFFLVCGDLVQALPGEELREEQEESFLSEFAKLDPEIPLILASGNHDVGRIPDAQSVKVFTDRFGDDYFGFWVGGVRCLVLNTQLWDNDSKGKDLRKEHDEWLENELKAMKASGCKHAVVFQHIPWFLKHAHEDKIYFNIEREFRLAMLDKFVNAGVKLVFSGHTHRTAGGVYRGLEQVVSSAMGWQDESEGPGIPGIQVVKVRDDVISHDYYGMDDIPSNIDL